MDIPTIRRANLTRIAATYPSKAAFARAADVDTTLMYKILHGTKNMGHKLARQVEVALKLTDGALSILDNVQNGQQSGIIPADHDDPQRALVNLLNASLLRTDDAQALLHLAIRLHFADSCTPSRMPIDCIRPDPSAE